MTERQNGDLNLVAEIDRQFEAVERGDLNALRDCFSPTARIWHNFDEAEMDVAATLELLQKVCKATTARRSTERRVIAVGNVCIVQHVFVLTLTDGRDLRMPAMFRFEFDAHGLVCRVEEYLDSRVSNALHGQANPTTS
jgi:ketosteroid isomerase-like protein